MIEYPVLIILIVYILGSFVYLYASHKAWEKEQQARPKDIHHQGFHSPCQNHARDQEWEEKEEEWNKRMDIIGTNGNEGTHYEEAHKDLP